MTMLQAIILGVVEGVTEFLPVSSTAHLVLAAKAIGVTQTEFAKTFEIAVQSGAIAAVILLYGKRLLTDKQTVLKVIAAFLPTAVIGLLAHSIVKHVFLESTEIIVTALALGGAVLIGFELLQKRQQVAQMDLRAISLKQAVLIGVCQSLAVIPGVSRAAATVIGGMVMGIPRATIVEFSFLLAVPTIVAASVLDVAKTGATFSGTEWQLLAVGSLTAFVVAAVVIRWFVRFIQRHTFVLFGIERIAIAAAAFALLR
jgi:undecaprenyl-diphosphatase